MPFPGYRDLYENVSATIRLQRLGNEINRFVFEENAAELTYDQRAMISRKISDLVAEAVQCDARELSHFALATVEYFEREDEPSGR
ncbi:MAG TPA: hypothetical protein VE974_06000 [Thermoanaerobaculia bacterium]|nr:hypothetical protein [Thermoanaerobaculia bacterium]